MTGNRTNKKVVATSRGSYRGFTILETGMGFVTILGTRVVSALRLCDLTAEIDRYLKEKLN